MPKTLTTDVLMVDFDNTLFEGHLSNELCSYPEIRKIITSHQISVCDYKNELNADSKAFFSYAQTLISQGKSFNQNVITKILDAFKNENQKVAIVTYSPFPDIIYELVVNELSSAYNVPQRDIEDKLKVVGGFPAGGQYSPNGKQEHVLSALIAFGAVEASQINADNVLGIFKGITLIDDSDLNISRALACGMNAILLEREDGTFNMHPNVGPPYAFNIDDLLESAENMRDSHEEHFHDEASQHPEMNVGGDHNGHDDTYGVGGAY